jgi:cytochrome P450
MMPPLHGERLRGYVASMREVTARAVSRFTVGSVQPLHTLFQEDHPRLSSPSTVASR